MSDQRGRMHRLFLQFAFQFLDCNHLRFNDLSDPEPVPEGTDYSSVLEADIPIVVQHTRLDSRQDANALLTTIAYAAKD